MNVAHLSTQKTKAFAYARIFGAPQNQRRAPRDCAEAPERTETHRPVMIPRGARLPRGEFFTRKAPFALLRGRFFSLRTTPSVQKISRYGVVVKKSTEALATKRNAWRRRIYAHIRHIQHMDMDMFFVLEKKPKENEKELVLEEITSLVRAAHTKTR